MASLQLSTLTDHLKINRDTEFRVYFMQKGLLKDVEIPTGGGAGATG